MSEDRAAEIVRRARDDRRGTSRTVWAIAAAIGVVGAIAFVVLMVGDRDATPTRPDQVVDDHRFGLGAGILIGVVVGIVIGYVAGRQSARSTP